MYTSALFHRIVQQQDEAKAQSDASLALRGTLASPWNPG